MRSPRAFTVSGIDPRIRRAGTPRHPPEDATVDPVRPLKIRGRETAVTSPRRPAGEVHPVVSSAVLRGRYDTRCRPGGRPRINQTEPSGESSHHLKQSGRHARTTGTAADASGEHSGRCVGSSVTGRGRPTQPASERGGETAHGRKAAPTTQQPIRRRLIAAPPLTAERARGANQADRTQRHQRLRASE